MTRPREERRREYREAPPRYRSSDNLAYHRPPSNQRSGRRYQEKDDYFYEEERPRYRDYSEQRRNHPRQPRDYEQRDRLAKQTDPRPYYPHRSYSREPLSQRPRTYPREFDYKKSYSLQQAKNSTNRKLFSFVYNLFFYTLTIGIILSSVMFAFSEKSDAAILGHRFYKVLTDSMAPQADSPKGGFYAGDIVIVKLMNGSEVKEGDVVTFRVGDGERYLTHRMVERLDNLSGIPGDYIVTKGDANNSNDPPITVDRVAGKVTFVIPKVGTFLAFVQENVWLCFVCALSTFGFFLVLKAYFVKPEEKQRISSYPRGI
ncbi:signal peptidase I [Candidatus Enterococcus ferrettii]|uniref:Signal peptidase I n=1 Tax=Candidatus Enterococcus ferrettii TaxID=2815324 RepID=A0ABV0EN03_9ENTE|nr:signal peptidase I [Enterococcus sp. 665A]MBO1339796.1 signal peptidase I [Enterococcus sp. 665A]